MRTRKNVWTLPSGDETLKWYGRAVEAMKAKPLNDPTSWRYQAAIHEYSRDDDPLASDSDELPTAAQQKKFWTKCQHGTWYFLPWHRMYLHHFEAIVAAEVVKLGGPADWALPYWNYSAGLSQRLLPTAFRKPATSANALYVADRDPTCNGGDQFADARDVDLRPSMTQRIFTGSSTGGSSGFGGPQTKFEHGGRVPGVLEGVPHGSMHTAVGGASGWMSAFNTAALDPIFWIHHANIDRLWEAWLKRDDSHENPDVRAWLRSVSFVFHDASGTVVKMTPADVLDTKAPPLSYEYDDTSDPLAPAVLPIPGGVIETARARKAIVAKQRQTEMVGATSSPIRLAGAVTHRELAVAAPAGPAKARKAAKPGGRREEVSAVPSSGKVYLNVENVTASRPGGVYDVYLNVPKGAEPRDHEENYAGRLPMFGVSEASSGKDSHGTSGLSYVFDVTALWQRLSAAGDAEPTKLRLSFVPVRPTDEPTKVQVGRVSVVRE